MCIQRLLDRLHRSGGQDRKIILWNPFSQKPLAQLNGHPTSVQQVLVNDKDNQVRLAAAQTLIPLLPEFETHSSNQVRLAVAQIPFPSCLNLKPTHPIRPGWRW